MRVYVDKYDRYEGVALLDFQKRPEYESFLREMRSLDYERDLRQAKDDVRSALLLRGLRFTDGGAPEEGKTYEFPEGLLRMNWVRERGLWLEEGRIDDEGGPTSAVVAFRADAKYVGENLFGPSLGNTVPEYVPNADWDPPAGLETVGHNRIKVIVRDIGQGNWNEIWSGERCHAIYDLGASITASDAEVRNYLETSEAMAHEPCLVISHWDLDHYHALLHMRPQEIRRLCCATVPTAVPTLTSERAFRALAQNCRYLRLIGPQPGRSQPWRVSLHPVFWGDNYCLFRGERSSDLNRSGLSLVVWSDQSSAILPGDHHYPQVFVDLYSQIPDGKAVNIVTPHHGGKAGRISGPFFDQAVLEVAATSTGANPYGHPREDVRMQLTTLGFEWRRTDHGGTITIAL